MLPKRVITSVGEICVPRRYYAGRDCTCKSVPWDQWAGIPQGHKLTMHARRMVTLGGSSWSFDQASQRLAELCHLQVSNDVIRAVCDEEGQEAAQWLKQSPEPAEQMAAAVGELEFYSDGVKVNTVGGWREMRINVFAKREPTTPVGPALWDKRVLEKPGCRVAWAAIAASYRIGATWKQMLGHLGLEQTPRLSVLGDGARWIWDEAAKRFVAITTVDWVVDVFHVNEHIHACAGAMFGKETPAAKRWATQRVEELIDVEGPRFIERLREHRLAATDEKSREALKELIGYLEENRDSLWYRTRLAQGLPIGSGLIEGTCKNTIGARLKLNSARWRVRRAEHMAALRCLQYGDLWAPYWAAKAA